MYEKEFRDVLRKSNMKRKSKPRRKKSKRKSKRKSPRRKKSICWVGYERVPGTKAYTQGSCRKMKFGFNKSTMKCNKPVKSTRPGKKRMVKACSGGAEKLVHYGASGYGHNYSASARRSFRARHRCNEAIDKLSARYWACKDLWAGKGGSVKKCPSNRRCKY